MQLERKISKTIYIEKNNNKKTNTDFIQREKKIGNTNCITNTSF